MPKRESRLATLAAASAIRTEDSMRILLLSREYPPETAFGGIATYAAAQANALRALNHEVVVIALAPGGAGASRRVANGVAVHRIPDRPRRPFGLFPRTREILAWSAAARRLAGTLGKFDAVEAPEYRGEGAAFARRPLEGDPALVVRLHAPLALVSRWHDEPLSLDLRAAIRVEERTLLAADLRLANSRFLAGAAARAAGISPAAIDVLPYPLEPLPEPRVPPRALRERLGLAGRPVALFTGRLEPRKGIVFLLEAFARLRRRVPEAALVLAGRDCPFSGGSSLSTLETAILRAGLVGERSRSIFPVGPVDRSEIAAYYRMADVFLQPARVEAFGFTTAESLAEGTPVVGLDAGGTPEIVDHEETGLLVRPFDPDHFAAAAERLLADATLRREFGAAALFRTRKRFDPAAIARQSVEKYAEAGLRRLRRRVVPLVGTARELAARLPERARPWVEAVEERTKKELWPHYFAWEALALLRALSFPDLRSLSILEPGSGHGVVSALLSLLGANVTLVDNDPAALRAGLEAARALGAEKLPTCLVGDVFHLPVKTGSFDVVWSDGVLEHFDEPQPALDEMARAAKPGGAVALLLPASATLHTAIWRPVRRGLGRYPFDRWGRERSFSARGLARFLEASGLEKVRVRRENARRSLIDDDLVLRRVRTDEGRRLFRALFAAIDAAEAAVPAVRALGFAVAGAGTKPAAPPAPAPKPRAEALVPEALS